MALRTRAIGGIEREEAGLDLLEIELAVRSREIFAEGDEEQMKQFINWCKQGSEKSKVENIDIHEEPLKNFRSFLIIH